MGGIVIILGAVVGYVLGHLVEQQPPTLSALLVILMMTGMGVVGLGMVWAGFLFIIGSGAFRAKGRLGKGGGPAAPYDKTDRRSGQDQASHGTTSSSAVSNHSLVAPDAC
jgi:hypothetical protein